MRDRDVWLAYLVFALFVCVFGLCLNAELQAKDKLVPVYKEDGLTIEYVIINGIEHQVLPTTSVDLLLETLDLKERQIDEQNKQIQSYIKISERQKADLEMCRTDRKMAYGQLDVCLAKEIPFYQTNEFSFVSGYAACAASYAIWSAVQK